MKHYTQLTREERYQISALKTAGQSKAQIAKILNRHKSTIGQLKGRVSIDERPELKSDCLIIFYFVSGTTG